MREFRDLPKSFMAPANGVIGSQFMTVLPPTELLDVVKNEVSFDFKKL